MKCYFGLMKFKIIKLYENGEYEIILDSVYCIISDGNYITVYYEKGNGAGHIHGLGSLKKMLQYLPKNFCRYNRFVVVNFAKLAVIEKHNVLVFRNGFSVKIKCKYEKKCTDTKGSE